MKTTTALVSLLLCSCYAGPSPADVQADRARWNAIRIITADGVIDANTEGPQFAELMVAWDQALLAREGAKRDWKAFVAELVKTYGIVAVNLYATPILQAKAPALFALADANHDGALTEQELLSIDPTNPVFAVVAIDTLVHLLKRK